MQTVLTIAGFDPSGGAGVLADIKTCAALGCYGVAAITSLTSQNTLGVYATFHQSAHVLQAQIEPLLKDYAVTAVKIGMLPTTELMEVVVETLARHHPPNVVIDPLLRSSSGYALMDEAARDFYSAHILRQADVVTPNLDEASVLLGTPISTLEEMKDAAEKLSHCYSQNKTVAVLLKGGHLNQNATDILFDGGQWHSYTTPKLASRHTHGTGCTLSAALAALLAQGRELPVAVARAKAFVTEAIRSAPGLGQGAGPMNHFYNYAPQSIND
ncbi:MAG TPA: bifunctional hydroxymethylpyrimidine kinase/phosphomethylpyrimidine kinase [Blastocatellia bacterium]|nr:bifunctional hydroxymethylpyrimidine kinase/phosphomethylpyrimidine kinase [Blastocatellia bacterium]